MSLALPFRVLLTAIALSAPIAHSGAFARSPAANDNAPVAVPTTLTGLIVAVADGDTVTLLDANKRQHRIRLAGIDAPEKAQAFGTRARQALGALAHERQAMAECDKQDRYGRLVCTLWVGTTEVNLRQLQAGMAWHYSAYAKEQPPAQRDAYEAAQTQAQAARLGLWRDDEPTPPWIFRKESRQIKQ